MPSYSNISKPSTSYDSISKFERESGYLLTEEGDYLLQENGSKIELNFPGDFTRIFKPTTSYNNISKPA